MFDPIHFHPMIVHFPIALVLIGLLSDLLGALSHRDFFIKTGFYMLLLGTAGVVAAYLSGNLAGEGVTEGGPLQQALETHEDAATLSLWVMVATALTRVVLVATNRFKGALRWLPLSLFILGALSVARTGYYGGQLVYKHAAGVQLEIGLGTSGDEIGTPAVEQAPTPNEAR